MAVTTAVFTQLNHTQIAIVSEQRQLNGAHCYYRRKYSFKTGPTLIELPGHLNKSSVCTVVYEYTLPYRRDVEADRYSFGLSDGKGDPRASVVEVSGAYVLRYRYDFTEEDHKTNTVPTPHQGLHVLQYTLQGPSIEVFLDGVQVSNTGKIVGREKEFFFIYGQARQEEPFELWEIHYTTPNPTVEFNRAFGFPHKNVYLGTGSYIQVFGTWTDKPQINDGRTTLAQLDTTGDVLLTLSIYPSNITVTNGLDKVLAKELPMETEIHLGRIRCNKPSELRDITIMTWPLSSVIKG